jgi:hypothetical protein
VSDGPSGVWGFVLSGEGETFIQEAADRGYAIVPLHDYAKYTASPSEQWRSYAPEYPPTALNLRMGGAGLSGLALTDKAGPFPEPWRDMMLVANPVTHRIQAVKMRRNGPYWNLDKPLDFLVSTDPRFRPVAISIGPDGCLYIVDWYNEPATHNGGPANQPDRDQARGRIWRVKATAAKPFEVPDFTKLSIDELIAKLGGDSLAQSHLAWQTLPDQSEADKLYQTLNRKLAPVIHDTRNSPARRIQALWALAEIDHDGIWIMKFPELARDENPLVRRALARTEFLSNFYTPLENAIELQPLLDDPDPEVRAYVIRTLGNRLNDGDTSDESLLEAVKKLIYMAKPPLAAPVAPSTRNGKPIKIREAYDREFERYWIRFALEHVPRIVKMALDHPGAELLPIENRLLAALALEPKESAGRIAALYAADDFFGMISEEEIERLLQFPEEPGVAKALERALAGLDDATGSVEIFLALRAKCDPAKIRPLLIEPTKAILSRAASNLVYNDSVIDDSAIAGLKLAGAFQLRELEPIVRGFANGERPVVQEGHIIGMEADAARPVPADLRAAATRALRGMGFEKTAVIENGATPLSQSPASPASPPSHQPDQRP